MRIDGGLFGIWFSCIEDIGTQYLDLSRRTNGMMIHICDADWRQIFGALGDQVSQAIMQYNLQQAPVEGSLRATTDGLSLVEGFDFDFDPRIPQLTLRRPVENGAQIQVCYDYWK